MDAEFLKQAALNMREEIIANQLVEAASGVAKDFEATMTESQRKFALELSESIILKVDDKEIVIGAVMDKVSRDDKEMMVA